MNFHHEYNPGVSGSVLFGIGLFILLVLNARRFNRRSSAGTQGFRCGYIAMLFTLLIEFAFRMTAYALLFIGLFMLFFG